MSYNQGILYDADPHVAEMVDQCQKDNGDLAFLRSLLLQGGAPVFSLRVLVPFCGTGRLLMPLALEGFHLVGFDQAQGMLQRARMKVSQLPPETQRRVTLFEADATTTRWPSGFDRVLLAGNCLDELGTPEEQARCFAQAALALKPGGTLVVDNASLEGPLPPAMQVLGAGAVLMSGRCTDGTTIEWTTQNLWFDAPRRLVRFRRNTRIKFADGRAVEASSIQQKHPVCQADVRGWIEQAGLQILAAYGDYSGNAWAPQAQRVLFLAQKR